MGRKYWAKLWNYVDLAIIVTFVCMTAFKLSSSQFIENNITEEIVSAVQQKPDMYPINFYELARLKVRFEDTMAVLVFISWIKVTQ